MSTEIGKSGNYIFNVAPIDFDSKPIEILAWDYENNDDLSNAIKKFRTDYNDQYIFARRGNRIIATSINDNVNDIGGKKEIIELDSDLGICVSLIKEALIRKISSNSNHEIYQKYSTINVINKNRNLISEFLIDSKCDSDKLAIYPKYEFSIRTLKFENQPAKIGISFKFKTSNSIDLNCAELIKLGVPLQGLYIQHFEENNGIKKRKLIGCVKEVKDTTLILDDVKDSSLYQIESELAYIEPKDSNLFLCISHLCGEKSGIITEKIRRKKYEFREGPEYLDKIRKFLSYLSKDNLEINSNIQFSIKNQFLRSNSGFFPRINQCEKPKYVFNHSCSELDIWHNRGLIKYGPFDRKEAPIKKPRITVICQTKFKKKVEVFIQKLLHGLPHIKTNKGVSAFGQGMVGLYHLKTPEIYYFTCDSNDAKDYKKASRQAVEHAVDNQFSWDLAIVQIEEHFYSLEGEGNPYLVTKNIFSTHNIPSQEFNIERTNTGDYQLAYILNNIALASYAKMGGTPWLLKSNLNTAHEIVIGLGSAEIRTSRLGDKEKFVGITTVFSGDGNYILANKSKVVTFDEYRDEFTSLLENVLTTIRDNYNWQLEDPINLIFHTFKPFKNVEIDSVKKVIENFKDYNIKYAFLDIVEDHPFLLFNLNQQGIKCQENKTKGIYAPIRGDYLYLNNFEVLLTLTGANELKKPEDGLPKPVLLRVNENSTYKDMNHITRQVFNFSCHSWRSFFPSSLPVTIFYSNLIAELMGKLNTLPHWNPDATLGQISYKRWFL